MRSKLFPLIILISVVSLLLIQACNSSSGGGGSNVPANKQSSEANISTLVVTASGADHTIDFGDNMEAIVDYPYSATALSSITIKSIGISAYATANVSDDQTVDLVDGKITITVTAQDGTKQTYTINLLMLANTEADITSLIVTASGADHTIDFGDNMEAIVDYPYSATALSSITIKSIGISAYATANVSDDQTVDLADGKIIITVTAQDSETKQTYTINLVMAANTVADITSLIVTASGADHTIDFGDNMEAIVDYPYSATALLSITIKSIGISAYATASVANDQTVDLADGKIIITVTAQDGTTVQTYTIRLVQAQPSSAAEITSLFLAVSGLGQDIAFDANRQASAYYPYGDSTPDSVKITSIAISAYATASVANDQTVDLADGKITITVIAQDGTSKNTYSILLIEFKTLRHILDLSLGTSTVPTDLSGYDELTQAVLAPYSANAHLIARYITIAGGAAPQGGTSWDDAAPASQLKPILDDTSGDASSERVYLILVASGATADASYDAGEAMQMQNHVAIIGGWDAIGGWSRSGSTVISGGNSHQVFYNNYSESSPLGSTSLLYGLAIVDGSADDGGGMFNSYSSPSMSNITLSANEARRGGGMFNSYSSPTMTNIIFSGNSADNEGGGMFNSYSSPTMSNVTFSANNSSSSNGGGIYNSYSAMTLSNITFSGNSVAYDGGGIYNYQSFVTMTNITLSANSAVRYGGGIHNLISSATMTNITLSANSADYGGGIYNSYSSTTMTNITLSGNSATQSGGGMYSADSKAITIVNSIFWDNSADTGAQIHISEQYPNERVILAYSAIEGGAPASADITANVATTNPSLSDLTTGIGSFVATMAISTGSSAINAGIYVRRLDYTDQSGDTKRRWYYSEDNSNWYTGFDSSGLTDPTADTNAEAEGSIDITATDATGTARSGRPDAGSYEAR